MTCDRPSIPKHTKCKKELRWLEETANACPSQTDSLVVIYWSWKWNTFDDDSRFVRPINRQKPFQVHWYHRRHGDDVYKLRHCCDTQSCLLALLCLSVVNYSSRHHHQQRRAFVTEKTRSKIDTKLELDRDLRSDAHRKFRKEIFEWREATLQWLTFSQAKRTGAVARPNLRSAAAGLPIVSDDDTKSKRSSTNWNARPRFLPYWKAVSTSGASAPDIVAACENGEEGNTCDYCF